jgi:hypothetical protein
MLMPADFDTLTAGLASKSDKIRALARHGVPTKDIARYLAIRYQHARNVLVHSGLHRVGTAPEAGKDTNGDAASGTTASIWVELDESGRLQIAPALLMGAGLRPGETVHVRLADGGFEVLSKRAALKRAQQIVSEFVPPGVSLVDELIAERRRETEEAG